LRGCGGEGGGRVGGKVGWGQEGEMTQALYAHMNNKIIKNILNIDLPYDPAIPLQQVYPKE
jgi:hypothetical protein